jgi:iron complex transport system substrate-binding protein
MSRVAWMVSVFAGLVILGLSGSADAGKMDIDEAVVVDSAGRRIAVSHPFTRIISLYGAHTENLFSMGARHRLIGVSPNDDWPPGAKAKPTFSYHDGLEKFLSASPDLVLIRPMIDRGYAQLMSRLEAHGIAVFSLQPSTVDEMYMYWMILGRLTGREARARQMIERFRRTVGRIHLRTSAIEDKKRVYFEAIHDRMRTFTPGAMPIFVLETAGGINVAADAVPRRNTNIADYGKERILSHAREIDIYLAQFGPMNRPTEKTIATEPGYDLIRAVQQDRIYFIDEKLVSRPTMRLLTGICSIGAILYPGLFRDGEESFGCPPSGRDHAGETITKDTQP